MPRSRRDSAARLSSRRARDLFRPREGLPLSDGQQPVRHDGAGAVHLSRHARRGAAVGGAQSRSRSAWPPAVAPAGLLPSLWNMPARAGSRPVRCWRRWRRSIELPQLESWPDDGGAFITLPQVYTEDADRPGWRRSNLGMYRVQLSGGQYEPNARSGCTTRFIAASACTTRRRSAAASRCA